MILRASVCVSLLVVGLCFLLMAAMPDLRDTAPYPAGMRELTTFDFAREARRRGDDGGAWLAVMKLQRDPEDHMPLIDEAFERAAALMPRSAAPQVLRGVTGVPLRRVEFWPTSSGKASQSRVGGEQSLTRTERQRLVSARGRLSVASALDPANAAVDYFLAYLALAEHDDPSALHLLGAASAKQRWNLYGKDVMSASYRVASGTLGEDKGALEAETYLDHSGFNLIFLARNVAAIADRARARGDHDTAIALYQSSIHMGELMVTQGHTLSEALCGQIVLSVAAHIPSDRAPAQATAKSAESRETDRKRVVAYFASHGRADLAYQLGSFGRRADEMMNRIDAHLASERARIRRLGRLSSAQESSYAQWGASLILMPLAALIALLMRLAGRIPVPPVWSCRKWVAILLAFVVAGLAAANARGEALPLAPALVFPCVPLGLALQRWRRPSAISVGLWRQSIGALLAIVFPMAAALGLAALIVGARGVAQLRAHTGKIVSIIGKGEVAYYNLLPP